MLISTSLAAYLQSKQDQMFQKATLHSCNSRSCEVASFNFELLLHLGFLVCRVARQTLKESFTLIVFSVASHIFFACPKYSTGLPGSSLKIFRKSKILQNFLWYTKKFQKFYKFFINITSLKKFEILKNFKV